jgi:hypothetical protein
MILISDTIMVGRELLSGSSSKLSRNSLQRPRSVYFRNEFFVISPPIPSFQSGAEEQVTTVTKG